VIDRAAGQARKQVVLPDAQRRNVSNGLHAVNPIFFHMPVAEKADLNGMPSLLEISTTSTQSTIMTVFMPAISLTRSVTVKSTEWPFVVHSKIGSFDVFDASGQRQSGRA
jgi:hypothetical protein